MAVFYIAGLILFVFGYQLGALVEIRRNIAELKELKRSHDENHAMVLRLIEGVTKHNRPGANGSGNGT